MLNNWAEIKQDGDQEPPDLEPDMPDDEPESEIVEDDTPEYLEEESAADAGSDTLRDMRENDEASTSQGSQVDDTNEAAAVEVSQLDDAPEQVDTNSQRSDASSLPIIGAAAVAAITEDDYSAAEGGSEQDLVDTQPDGNHNEDYEMGARLLDEIFEGADEMARAIEEADDDHDVAVGDDYVDPLDELLGPAPQREDTEVTLDSVLSLDEALGTDDFETDGERFDGDLEYDSAADDVEIGSVGDSDDGVLNHGLSLDDALGQWPDLNGPVGGPELY